MSQSSRSLVGGTDLYTNPSEYNMNREPTKVYTECWACTECPEEEWFLLSGKEGDNYVGHKGKKRICQKKSGKFMFYGKNKRYGKG